MLSSPLRQRVYDHRLRQAVWETGDPHLFPELHMPRSTLAGWLKEPPPDVVTADCLVSNDLALALKMKRLERRCGVLTALIRLLLALVRRHGLGRSSDRVPDGAAKTRILRAIDSARKALTLANALKVLDLTPGRYRAWRRAARGCGLDDKSSCPMTSPSTLTANEVATMREMVTSPDYRHMSLGCLALFAQREGKLYAAPSTWRKLSRERGRNVCARCRATRTGTGRTREPLVAVGDFSALARPAITTCSARHPVPCTPVSDSGARR